jgi:hypothetical protein
MPVNNCWVLLTGHPGSGLAPSLRVDGSLSYEVYNPSSAVRGHTTVIDCE